MHFQRYFGKVKWRLCSSIESEAAVTLRYVYNARKWRMGFLQNSEVRQLFELEVGAGGNVPLRPNTVWALAAT